MRDLAAAVGTALTGRGWTLSVAESCTGGLILKTLTDIPGSSGFLMGGVVAYANRVKTACLEVEPELLEEHGAVSREVARAMAHGVQRAMGTEVGLAVTGIAGPGGGTPGKPVGTVWFGLALPDRLPDAERAVFDGGREAVRTAAALRALQILFEAAS